MKSISKEFESVYGNGKPLSINSNKSINNMLKNIPNKHFESNVSNNVVNVEKKHEFPYGMLLLFIVLLLLWAIYYFRENIFNLFKDEEKEKEKKEKEEKEKKKKKAEEEKKKKDQEEINKGGVKQLDDKINTLSAYKQEQLVKENSYCYIGTDNGQRECINAYAGDVCMSGQIFPKMEICINPNLRL